MEEKSRQYETTIKMRLMQKQLDFARGDNLAGCGKYLDPSYLPKPGDFGSKFKDSDRITAPRQDKEARIGCRNASKKSLQAVNKNVSPRQDIVKRTILLRTPTTPQGLLERETVHPYDDPTKILTEPQRKKRKVLLIVAHGRSGSTFLADIFNKHPEVFYVFEPLHGVQRLPIHGRDYDKFAMNFLLHIFQCDFSVGNATRHIGRFYRVNSRVLSSPPFCKYEQADPRWKKELCSPVEQQDLEHSCEVHDTIVYKLLLERIPGQSIEKLFEVCEVAGIECKVIHLVRDVRPLVISSRKMSFFKEFDKRTRPSMRQFTYSHCEMTEKNLYLVKNFQPFLRSLVTLVRYEDLTVEPFKVLNHLYEFAGLELLDSIKQWVVKMTQPSINDLEKERKRPVSVRKKFVGSPE
ncbi:hypothetical protein ACROYT_G009705 [Oculina patagonica]